MWIPPKLLLPYEKWFYWNDCCILYTPTERTVSIPHYLLWYKTVDEILLNIEDVEQQKIFEAK